MGSEIPLQWTESGDGSLCTPFSHSALAAVARSRAAQNVNRVPELTEIEIAVACGEISLEAMSLTTELI